ncbi:hypothetical protein EG329_010116 [Mollisiaceae sp. DMI_Dod_QoI]|nr:hypothetical protein EG329_010116 [Helotiales sp. DMI_Dod_QoI]
MLVSPHFLGSTVILLLQLWNVGVVQVEGLRFTVDSWTGIVTDIPFLITWAGAPVGSKLTLSLENGTLANPLFLNNIASDRAIPGQEFFLKIADLAGTSALGGIFTVAATASSSSSTFTATPPATSSISTSLSSTSATQTGPVTASSTPNEPSSGLSTGAKAGIGVGAVLGAITIISLLTYFILRIKKVARLGSKLYELVEDNMTGRSSAEKKSYVVAHPGPPVEMQAIVPRGRIGKPEMDESPGMRAEMIG